jgi:hypothetical protein
VTYDQHSSCNAGIKKGDAHFSPPIHRGYGLQR